MLSCSSSGCLAWTRHWQKASRRGERGKEEGRCMEMRVDRLWMSVLVLAESKPKTSVKNWERE